MAPGQPQHQHLPPPAMGTIPLVLPKESSRPNTFVAMMWLRGPAAVLFVGCPREEAELSE